MPTHSNNSTSHTYTLTHLSTYPHTHNLHTYTYTHTTYIGAYTISPPVVDSPTRQGLPGLPLTNQNFLSGGERFKQDVNNNNNSAPGKYTLATDFDIAKTKILKSKSLKVSGRMMYI